MLPVTSQLSFSAKIFSRPLPPPKKSSQLQREYLRSDEVKAMIGAAKKVGRHGVRDAALILLMYPYLQYFIGKTHYSSEAPYDPSLLTRFRERINVNLVNQINETMVSKSQPEIEEEPKKKAQPQKGRKQEKSKIKGN